MERIQLREIAVRAALDLLPPDIVQSLLNDKAFLTRWGISTECNVTLGNQGPTFPRECLHSALRAAMEGPTSEGRIEDESGVAWTIRTKKVSGEVNFTVSSGDKSYVLPDHSALSTDMSSRVAWFERATKGILLDRLTDQKWRSRLCDGPLSSSEFEALVADIDSTPVRVLQRIEAALARRTTSIATLVPNERQYYHRLVGLLDDAGSIPQFVSGGATTRLQEALRWGTSSGLLSAFITCSIGEITSRIDIGDFSREEIIRTYDWIAEKGDPLTRLAAVEVAIRNLDRFPNLSDFVEKTVNGFISDNPDSDDSDFALLSAAVVMTDSELARRRTLGAVPPFYRRHASIAHASLVVQAAKEARVEASSFLNWIKTSGLVSVYFCQGLIDLRVEPRWLPDFVSADQLRAEFIGRIANIAMRNSEKLGGEELRSLLIGPDSKLAGATVWPMTMLPGPLEGATPANQPVPADLLAQIRASLSDDRLKFESFVGLINSVLLFDLSRDEADLAAKALQRANFLIHTADTEEKMHGLISGLAVVASVTRSTELANVLRVFVRVVRRRKRINLDPADELRVAMVASASFADIRSWAQFAGEWIKEIAFEVEKSSSAQTVRDSLRCMVRLSPDLANQVAAADAALAVFAQCRAQ